MGQKQTIGEVLIFFSKAIAVGLLLPVVGPIVMWGNIRGYADKYAYLPGIRSGGGFTSGLAALVYVGILVVIVGGAVAATGDAFSNDQPNDGDAAIGTPTPEPQSTATPTLQSVTERPIETERTPVMDTSTLTPPSTPQETFTQGKKYRLFTDAYVDGAEKNNVSVKSTKVDPENGTVYLTYELTNLDNPGSIGDDAKNASLMYAATVDAYLSSDDPSVDKSWIPRQVNITALSPAGGVYRKGYVKYEWAYKLYKDQLSVYRYILNYYNTLEPGPAHPDYEG